MKISAGSSRIGGPLCLYDEDDNPIALMSDKLADKERVALEIVAAVNGRDWQPIETAPKGTLVLLWHPLWRAPLTGQSVGGRRVMLIASELGPDDYESYEAMASNWMPLPEPPPFFEPATTGTPAGNPKQEGQK